MHILIVTDQHPDSLGGAQVAIRAQRASLERLGHRVTVAAPALHRADYQVAPADREAYIALPSRPITKDREYGITWPGGRTRRALSAGLASLPPVDLVHVQGDFWGALIGVRAARDLQVPHIFTLHNNVDQGTRAVTPFAPVAFGALRMWRSFVLGSPRGPVNASSRGAWRYLAELTAEAAAVLAPSQHFAARLESKGVAATVGVARNGIDDDLIRQARQLPRASRDRPRLVWLGRMSHEKRVLEFVDAVAASGIDAEVRLYGAGLLLEQVQDRIRAAGLGDRMTVAGPVSHEDALAALRDADALVQTSVGFETQGLTPFEAAALGTPTIFCDAAIADDVAMTPAWTVPSGDSVSDLAETLRQAVAQLAVGGDELRVSEGESAQFLQSEQIKQLIRIYERVLD